LHQPRLTILLAVAALHQAKNELRQIDVDARRRMFQIRPGRRLRRRSAAIARLHPSPNSDRAAEMPPPADQALPQRQRLDQCGWMLAAADDTSFLRPVMRR
jgi:hypothetical protein